MVWASRWSVALRAFYRQFFSLTYSFFSLKLPPPACPGTTGIYIYTHDKHIYIYKCIYIYILIVNIYVYINIYHISINVSYYHDFTFQLDEVDRMVETKNSQKHLVMARMRQWKALLMMKSCNTWDVQSPLLTKG